MRALMAGAAVVLVTATLAGAQATTTINGTDGDDRLSGTPGPDAIYGGRGADTLDGTAGDDQLDGGPGADVLRGGPGTDAVLYGGGAPVKVSLDNLGGDGAEGEGDSVGEDVEAVFTGAGGDVLTGSPRPEMLDGGGGDDTVDGGEGEDHLYGGPGDDTINAIDGAADIVDCGDGRDLVTADEQDGVSGCESVARATPRRVEATVKASWEVFDGRARALSILVASPPRPGTIEVRCSGRGCRSARRDVNIPERGPANAASALRRARLARGARVEVRVNEPGSVGLVVRYVMRGGDRGPSRRVLCLPPTQSRPVPC